MDWYAYQVITKKKLEKIRIPLKTPKTRIGGIGETRFARKDALVVADVMSIAVAARRKAHAAALGVAGCAGGGR